MDLKVKEAIFGIIIIYFIIIIISGIVWAIFINLILGLIMIGFSILGLFYCGYYFTKTDNLQLNNESEVYYWMLIAPIDWIISFIVIFFSFGWNIDDFFNPKNIEVLMIIWLISSFIWYVIPILGILIIREGVKIFRKIKDQQILFYFLLFAPIGFIITSNVILFNLGYKLSDYNVFISIWLISSLFWFIIPTLIILIVKYKIFISLFTSRSEISDDQKYLKKIEKKRERKKEKKELKIKKKNFKNLIKKSNKLINKGNKLISSERFSSAVENWKQSINYYSQALEKAPNPDENNLIILREKIYNLYLKFLSIDCSITKGVSLIFQNNKIITKPHFGLNIFLAKWLESKGDDSND